MNAAVNVRPLQTNCVVELRTWILQLRCIMPWLKIEAIKLNAVTWDILAEQVTMNTAADRGGPYVYREGQHDERLPHFFTEGVMFIKGEGHASTH